MTDPPDRLSQPSPKYDSWQHGENPTIPPELFGTPMGLPPFSTADTADTEPSELAPVTARGEDLIPGPNLRETLGALETTLEAHGVLLHTIVVRLASVESISSGARAAAEHCVEAVTRYMDGVTRAHQRLDAVEERVPLRPSMAAGGGDG
jgi:hypothetical protein